MKTIFRFLSTGILSAAAVAVMATAGFGQNASATPNANCADIDGHNALYTKFTSVYAAKSLPDMKTALSTGKEYLEKYGTCTEAFADQINFVKPHVARLEKAVGRAEVASKYDAAVKADTPAEIAAAGKEFLAIDPENVNVMLPIALSASYKSTKENNYQFSDQGIQYANMALAKLKGGWTLNKKDDKGNPVVGVFQYTYSKDNAIGELTYALAYLNYYGKKNKQAALPLYYDLSQSTAFKTDPRVYGTIGDFYVEEGAPVGEEIAKLISDQKAATDDAVKADLDNKIKAKIALFNGYTERALDAYSRAYNVAKPGPYKDNLYKVMGNLYKRRFEKETGLDAYVSSTIAKPFPNPTTPVQPIADPEPTTTTTTSGSAAAAPATTKPGTTTTAPAATKPATTTPAPSKSATSTPTKPVSSVTTKSTVAKKGTRR